MMLSATARRIVRPARFAFFLSLILVYPLALSQDTQEPANDFIAICPIHDEIDDATLVLVKRALREVQGAKALIFEVNTPGGRVDSAVEITDAIGSVEIPTVAYIKGMGAISAGAMISYACDQMVMAPGSNIGASTPIMMGPEGVEPVGEKMTSYVRAKFRALAEQNGYNPDIAQAMVDEKIELRAKESNGEWVIYSVYSSEAATAEPALERVEKPEPSPIDMIRKLAEGESPLTFESPPAPEPVTAEELKEVRYEDGSILVSPKGQLLTWTPMEAQKFGLIEHMAASQEGLMKVLGYEGLSVVRIEPTWSEQLFKWLISPTVSGILLLLGLAGLYFEMQHPGVSWPGIIGVSALIIFMGSRAVIGLADWIDVLLIIVGIALVLVELLLIPGFGITGAVGILCVITGIIMSFSFDDFTIPQYEWQFDRLRDAGQALCIALVLFLVLIAATWRYFPRTSVYHHLVLADAQNADAGYVVQSEEEEALVGATGTAISMLRPAGRGRFNGQTLSIVSRGEFIENGTPVIIVGVDGNRYVVDPIREKA